MGARVDFIFMIDPQFSLPLTITSNGDVAIVQTGSRAEAAQRAAVICGTRPGEIDGVPEFGVYDQVGRAGGADLGEIERQLDKWAPELEGVATDDPSALDRALSLVGVRVVGT